LVENNRKQFLRAGIGAGGKGLIADFGPFWGFVQGAGSWLGSWVRRGLGGILKELILENKRGK